MTKGRKLRCKYDEVLQAGAAHGDVVGTAVGVIGFVVIMLLSVYVSQTAGLVVVVLLFVVIGGLVYDGVKRGLL